MYVVRCMVCFLTLAVCFKPIIMMHGFESKAVINGSIIKGTSRSWDKVVTWVRECHPGTSLFALAMFEGVESHKLLWELRVLSSAIREIQENNTHIFQHGWIGMGHSQGALILRCLAKDFEGHNMHTLISIAGPQAGYFGIPCFLYHFGDLPSKLLTRYLYSKSVQEELSIANFWKDPYEHDLYLEKDIFLPILNNEVHSIHSG
jgi:hypothetical protein